MKQTLITLVWCALCAQVAAQTVTVTPGTSMTIKNVQTLPNLVHKGSITVADSATLRLKGTTSGAGTLSVTPTSSLVSLAQSVGTVYFNPSKNTIKNVYVEGMLTLGNALNITAGMHPGTVKIRGGTLFSDSFLTLKSDLWGTARIDSSSGNILGLVNVERYIPPNRAWRFLTVPFAPSPQSINQAWQEGYTNMTLACPSQYPGVSGYGTHLTYNALNGYDKNTTSNASLLMLQNNHWSAPSSTLTTKITDYSAYAVFVRGDRTICLSQATSAVPVPTTLRASGLVSVGAVTRSYATAIGEYLLEGNPYASSIDVLPMMARSAGIVPETFWIFDPGYGDNGGYVAYSYGVIAPLTSNYPTPLSVRTAQSGQGYMLQATDSTQQIKYEEADKVPTQSSLVFGRPAKSNVVQIQLLNESGVVDGVAVRFVGHATDTTHKTLPKLWKFTGEGMVLIRNNRTYSIETRVMANTDTCLFGFRSMKTMEYSLEVVQSSALPLQLIDKLLHKEMPIDDTLRYTFAVRSSDSVSYTNRFMLVYAMPDTPSVQTAIAIYPNPVLHTLYIAGIANPVPVRITDVVGRVWFSGAVMAINCEALPRGVYFITINGTTRRFEKL